MTSNNESALRKRANRIGYRIEKSHQQQHSNNCGEFMLIDDRNIVVLGDRYSARLDHIADYLDTLKAKRKAA